MSAPLNPEVVLLIAQLDPATMLDAAMFEPTQWRLLDGSALTLEQMRLLSTMTLDDWRAGARHANLSADMTVDVLTAAGAAGERLMALLDGHATLWNLPGTTLVEAAALAEDFEAGSVLAGVDPGPTLVDAFRSPMKSRDYCLRKFADGLAALVASRQREDKRRMSELRPYTQRQIDARKRRRSEVLKHIRETVGTVTGLCDGLLTWKAWDPRDPEWFTPDGIMWLDPRDCERLLEAMEESVKLQRRVMRKLRSVLREVGQA